MGALLVFHGSEPFERTDRGRVRSGRRYGAGHGPAIARRCGGQKKPACLRGEIEAAEVYVVAGQKGHPELVAKLGRKGRRRRLKGKPGRDTLADEKPPIWGLLQRTGEVVIHRLPKVYVNTLEGFWSLLRPWLRPHRGLSQEKLPLYLGFFEFVHNARRRGKALLGVLLAVLVAP